MLPVLFFEEVVVLENVLISIEFIPVEVFKICK